MKNILALTLASTVLMACEPPVHVGLDYQRIETESQFKELIDGRTFHALSNDGVYILHSDGKVTGTVLELDVAGYWEWEGGYCREITIDGEARPYECMDVWVAGNYVRYDAERGLIYYTIE